jgi:protein tyrosine/serine phosphatase
MLRNVGSSLKNWKRSLRDTFGRNITDPRERRWSVFHAQVFDQALLRHLWHNFHQIAPGVYRSNNPGHTRFKAYKAMGIKTIVNLRGTSQVAHHLFECESCEALGLTLVNVKFHAKLPPARDEVLRLLEYFRTVERPFLMHCKSGADRAGLACALYLLAEEGASVPEAREQLHLRYLHLRGSATGVLDHVLDHYEDRLAQGRIGIEEWVATEYDPEVVKKSWQAKRGRK